MTSASGTAGSRRRIRSWKLLACALGIAVLSFAAAVGYYRYCSWRDRLLEIPPGLHVANGDVILLGSATCRGIVVKLIDGNHYAHTGLAEVDAEGRVWLIHADPAKGGVCRDVLSDYLKSNVVDGVFALHPTNATGAAAEAAVRFARSAAERQVPFDDTFRYAVGDGMYCTELVLLSWEQAGVRLLPAVKRGDSVYPGELAESPALVRRMRP